MAIDKDRVLQNGRMSEIFKTGWDEAGKEGCVSPELKKALIEELGVHPDRVQQFADALMTYTAGKGEKPDPSNFSKPVVLAMRSRLDDVKTGPVSKL